MSTRKQITTENFLEVDLSQNVDYPPGGGELPWKTPKEIVEYVNAPANQLTHEVPDQIVGLFEAAKAAFAYSLFYSPLRAMAWHYALLAVEAALFERYVGNGGPNPTATMEQTVPYLKKHKVLPQIRPHAVPPKYATGYDWVSFYRSKIFAHPKVAIGVAAGLSNVEICAELINALFKGLAVTHPYMPGDAPKKGLAQRHPPGTHVR